MVNVYIHSYYMDNGNSGNERACNTVHGRIAGDYGLRARSEVSKLEIMTNVERDTKRI